MTTALIVGVIALGGAIVARVTWRRVADERQSVQHHQHTLETLRHIADSREQPLRGPVPSPGAGARPRPPRLPRRHEPPGPPPAPGGPPSGPGRRAERVGRREVRGRGRAVLAVAAVVVVGAAAAVAVAVGSSSTSPGSHGPHHGGGVAAGRGTTTVPPHESGAPVSDTASGATYVATRAHYTVVLDATGPCWVMARDTATGAVVWTGTLPGGDTHSLSATGTLAVELGAPGSVSVSMDGTPVRFPAGYVAPFTMTFEAGAAGAS